MAEYQDTIEQVLMSINPKEVRTMAQIKQQREEAVDDVMEDFMCYPKNKENINKIKKDLENYELVPRENLYKHDTILFLNSYHFYDIYLEQAKVIRLEDGENMRLKIFTEKNSNLYKTKPVKYAFRKLSDEDKVKINLVEAIYSMDK